MGLVGSLSMKFARRWPALDVDDLRQVASIALLDSVRGFDASRGYQFSTYACRSILRRIIQYRKQTLSRPLVGEFDFESVGQRRFSDPHDTVVAGDEKKAGAMDLGRVLGQLKPVEARVLRLRFGLDTAVGCDGTLRGIGDLLGVSKERVRQVEKTALRKAREMVG